MRHYHRCQHHHHYRHLRHRNGEIFVFLVVASVIVVFIIATSYSLSLLFCIFWITSTTKLVSRTAEPIRSRHSRVVGKEGCAEIFDMTHYHSRQHHHHRHLRHRREESFVFVVVVFVIVVFIIATSYSLPSLICIIWITSTISQYLISSCTAMRPPRVPCRQTPINGYYTIGFQ